MCLAPSTLEDGTVVACKACELCRQNRINDLIGRCVAEQRIAKKTVAVTLTYSGDGAESAVLRYSDVQVFIRSIRDTVVDGKRPYKVRYICAGEYGTKKGRAHWHIILFFENQFPAFELGSRINWSHWPHGFSYFQNADYKGFQYILKYALKQDGVDGYSKALSMSKKPPLGYSFFMNMADDLVDRRLPVHSPEYAFAGLTNSKGETRRFWLQGRMRELFLDRYYSMWRMQYGNEPPWSDYFLERYLDKIERDRMDLDPIRYDQEKAVRDALAVQRQKNLATAEFWDSKERPHAVGYLVFPSSDDIITAMSDYSAECLIGNKKWQVTEGNVTVAAQLLRAGLPKSKVQQVSDFLESQWRNHRHLLSQKPSLS